MHTLSDVGAPCVEQRHRERLPSSGQPGAAGAVDFRFAVVSLPAWPASEPPSQLHVCLSCLLPIVTLVLPGARCRISARAFGLGSNSERLRNDGVSKNKGSAAKRTCPWGWLFKARHRVALPKRAMTYPRHSKLCGGSVDNRTRGLQKSQSPVAEKRDTLVQQGLHVTPAQSLPGDGKSGADVVRRERGGGKENSDARKGGV